MFYCVLEARGHIVRIMPATAGKGHDSYYMSSGLQNTVKHYGFETLYYCIEYRQRLCNASPVPWYPVV